MNDTTQLPYAVSVTLNKAMLKRGLPFLQHERYGSTAPLAKNSSNTQKWEKYGALATSTTPLTEGVTPAGSTLSKTSVTVTVQQYGDFVEITDWVDMTSFDPALINAAEVLGEQALQSRDEIVRDIISAGTNVQRANGAVSRVAITSSDKLTTTELKKARRTMGNNFAKKLTQIVRPDMAYGTTPVAPCYIVIIDTNTVYDVEELPGFRAYEDYSNKSDSLPNEIGKWREFRFVETQSGKVFAGEGSGGIDVYGTLVIGKDAYAVTDLMGEALQNIVQPFGSGGTTDPLKQRATSGWKMAMSAVILQQLFMLRIEHAVSS